MLERIIGIGIIGALALFNVLLMSGLIQPSEEWMVFSDAKKGQIVIQVTSWMLLFVLWDLATRGRTLAAIMECDKPVSSSEDKKAAAILYAGIAIALAILIGKGAF